MSEHDVLSYSLFPTIAVVLFQQSVACPDAAVDCARQDLKAKRSISQNLKVLTLRMANYSFSKATGRQGKTSKHNYWPKLEFMAPIAVVILAKCYTASVVY